MSDELSLVNLVIHASLLVQVVMALLVLASILSWAVILHKAAELRRARQAAARFEKQFWSGINLGDLYSRLSRSEHERTGMEAIFESGFREYSRLHRKGAGDARLLIDGARRAMRVSLSREEERLDRYLSFLANVGSISPFVGLFGTVWGIMHAFIGLGNVKQATLSMVAPGIAEALIATALGLFAAIPAVMAYNRYVDRVDRQMGRLEGFAEEFTGFLQRQSLASGVGQES